MNKKLNELIQVKHAIQTLINYTISRHTPVDTLKALENEIEAELKELIHNHHTITE